MIDREALIDDGRVLHTAFTDFNAIDKEVAEITSEIDVLSGLVQKLVDENASTTLDQTEYLSLIHILLTTSGACLCHRGCQP